MKRVQRIAASMAIVLVVYWTYRVVAVPLIEPEASETAVASADVPVGTGLETGRRHNQLLAQLYPEGAWQRDNPIVLEGDRAMLVFKEWRNRDDGRVELNPCTMIFFPSGDPSADTSAVRRAVVMEAAQGALLEFAEPFDIRRAKIGRLVGGRLPGPIIVRGNPGGPGPQGELYAETRDVQLDERRIWSPHPVRFRLGPSYGSGREMQINLLPGGVGGRPRGPNIGGLDSFELLSEVTMHVQPGSNGLLPGDRSSNKPQNENTAAAAPPAPVDINCRGPFQFDLVNFVARFKDRVNVLRQGRGPQSDEMTCELLAIHFAPRHEAADGPAVPRTRSTGRDLSTLEPRRIEADGLPVVVTSPSTGARAVGQHLEYEIATGALMLRDPEETVLVQESNEIHALQINYQPADPKQRGLGRLVAVGPGWLKGQPRQATTPMEARWTTELRLQPDGEQQVICVQGTAQLHVANLGQLAGDYVYLWLAEAPPDANNSNGSPPTGTAATGSPNARRTQWLPQRLLAKGNVNIQSQQINTPADKPIDQLEVWFKQAPATPAGSIAGTLGPTVANGSRAQPGPLNNGSSSGDRSLLGSQAVRYEVAGKLVRMEMIMRGRTLESQRGAANQVDKLIIEGDVHFAETQTAQPGELPLVVKGDHLQVFDAASPQTKVTVSGRPAHVEARGMVMVGSMIEMSRGRNRMWIDGPGQMTLPVDRDLQGRALAQTRLLHLTWQGGMDFDGLTANFREDITAQGADNERLRTPRLEVTMAKRINFGQPQGGERPQVALITCPGPVELENKAPDGEQPMIQRMQTRNLSINQTTGAINAAGPGWFTMVRLGPPVLDADQPGSSGGLLAFPTPRSNQAARSTGPTQGGTQSPGQQRRPAEPELSYLNIQFQKEITGNLNQRELTFHGQVNTVQGPIKNWDEELNADKIENLGPRGVCMSCDALKLVEMAQRAPGQTRGAVELEASGNVEAEGNWEGTNFYARGGRLSFAEAKDLIVLEGDGRSDAHLYRQQLAGSPPQQAAARKILYWRSAQRVDVGDARFFDLGQLQSLPSSSQFAGGGLGAPKPKAENPKPKQKQIPQECASAI